MAVQGMIVNVIFMYTIYYEISVLTEKGVEIVFRLLGHCVGNSYNVEVK